MLDAIRTGLLSVFRVLVYQRAEWKMKEVASSIIDIDGKKPYAFIS